MIPKIVHQVAPRNKEYWHPMWKLCRESWEKNFSEFEMILWYDDDGVNGIDKFVEENYPQYYSYYKELDHHIMQIDFARYLILHKYGGIYADMDVFCYQNFYDDLNINSLCLLEGCKEGDKVENAIIAAPPNCNFFIDVIELSFDRFYNYKSNKEKYGKTYKIEDYVLEILGPAAFSDVYYDYYEDKVLYKGEVYIMPKSLYNMPYYTYDKSYKTKHMLTGIWGRSSLDEKIGHVLNEDKNVKESIWNEHYQNFRKINLKDFDFYTQYVIKVDQNGNETIVEYAK